MENMDGMLRIINLVIGVWATYAAISGKGAAYKNDYPKAIKADADALMRKFFWIIGPFLIVSTGALYLLEYLKVDAGIVRIIDYVSSAIVVIWVIVLVVLLKKRFGKYLK